MLHTDDTTVQVQSLGFRVRIAKHASMAVRCKTDLTCDRESYLTSWWLIFLCFDLVVDFLYHWLVGVTLTYG